LLQDIVISTSLHEAVSTKLNSLPNELGQNYQEFCLAENDALRQLKEVILSVEG